MRQALDRFYRISGGIGAFFIAAICVTVLIQVSFNLIDRIAQLTTGKAYGLVLPSYAEFAGYFLAAGTFFALADTLQSGNHIRVNLVIQRVSGKARNVIEAWCCLLGATFSAYFTYWATNHAYESFVFGDLSPGIVPVPLWIPQVSMILGLVALTICFVDLFFQVLAGRNPDYLSQSEEL
ncbi:MAG: TRAP transporter small permease [Pseudomonadota bacterium]